MVSVVDIGVEGSHDGVKYVVEVFRDTFGGAVAGGDN